MFTMVMRCMLYIELGGASHIQVDQLAAKSIAEVLSEPEGQRLQQQEFVHVDAEAPLSYASGTTTVLTATALTAIKLLLYCYC
jgi:hypothetical protein